MQTVVIISVFVAIFSQVISILWGIKDAIINFFRNRRLQKQQKITAKLDKEEREARTNLGGESEAAALKIYKNDNQLQI